MPAQEPTPSEGGEPPPLPPVMPFGPAPTSHPVPGPPPPPVPPRRRRPGRRPLVLAAVFGGAGLLVAGTITAGVATGAITRPPDTGTAAHPGSIRDDFDPANAALYLPGGGEPTTKVTVRDGTQTGDAKRKLTLDSEPVYADVDDDGDTDAAAIYHRDGRPGAKGSAWRGVYVWLWDDGAARPVPRRASGQKDCVKGAELAVEAGTDGLRVTRAPRNGCGADPGLDAQMLTITVRGDIPVVTAGEHIGAVHRCWRATRLPDDRRLEVTGKVTPVVAPAADAAPAGDDHASVDLYLPKRPAKHLTNGHIIAVLGWEGGDELCGWVPWDEVSADTSLAARHRGEDSHLGSVRNLGAHTR